ncbi:MAG: TonB-dependent receptor [Planctomycetes bacterium]|nr:TonB-dependent receptor [Planctomycetota bacterium]
MSHLSRHAPAVGARHLVVALVLSSAAFTFSPARADEPDPVPSTSVPAPAEAPEVLPDVVVRPPTQAPVTSADPVGPTAASQVPQPVSVAPGSEVSQHGDAGLGDALEHMTGVTSTAFGPGASRPVIRGQGGERIRVLENGTGTLDVSSISDDHAIPVDLNTVERVELIRGPATLRYGPRAIGGVAYVHDGRVPEGRLCRRVGGRISGAYGTANEEWQGAVLGEAQQGCWVARASAVIRRSEDYDIPGFAKSDRLLAEEGNPSGAGEVRGTLPNSYVDAEGGAVGVSRLLDRGGFVGAAFSAYSTEYGVPNEPDVHIELERYRFDLRGEVIGPFRGMRALRFDAAFADYEHTEFEGTEEGTVFDQTAWEARVELAHCPWGCAEGAFGFQVAHADLTVVGEEALLPSAETLDLGVFAYERFRLRRNWRFDLGARLDFRDIDSTASKDFYAFSASAGLVWTPRCDVTVALATAYTSRAPTAFELYADGPHVATEAYEVGDPDLDLERALGTDLSIRYTGRRSRASITGFYQRYLDYIGLNATGAVDIDSGLPVYQYGRTEAELYGAEAELGWTICQRGCSVLEATASGDMVRATDLETDDPLPRIPPLRLGCGLSWRTGRWILHADWKHAFEQDRTAPDELATDGYDRLDAGIAYRLPVGCGRCLTLGVEGTNLLDDEIRHHASFVKDLAPARGRSVRFKIQLDL